MSHDNEEAAYIPSRKERVLGALWREHQLPIVSGNDASLDFAVALAELYDAEMRHEEARQVMLRLPIPGATGEQMRDASVALRDSAKDITAARDRVTELLG